MFDTFMRMAGTLVVVGVIIVLISGKLAPVLGIAILIYVMFHVCKSVAR